MEADRLKILQMVEDGKLTPDEGVRLMDAVRRKLERQAPPRPAERHLRVSIGKPGEEGATFAVPLALARMALRFLPRSAATALEREGITVADLADLVTNAEDAAGSSDLLEFESRAGRVVVRVEGP